MILDNYLLFSDKQDLAQTAAAYLSDKSIDLGAAATSPGVGGTVPNDVGKGGCPEILCEVVEAFTSLGSATLQVDVVMADDAALTSNLTILHSTPAIPKATLVAGYQFRVALPAGVTKRYLGLQYTVGTATTTAGKITAGLVLDKQTHPFVG